MCTGSLPRSRAGGFSCTPGANLSRGELLTPQNKKTSTPLCNRLVFKNARATIVKKVVEEFRTIDQVESLLEGSIPDTLQIQNIPSEKTLGVTAALIQVLFTVAHNCSKFSLLVPWTDFLRLSGQKAILSPAVLAAVTVADEIIDDVTAESIRPIAYAAASNSIDALAIDPSAVSPNTLCFFSPDGTSKPFKHLFYSSPGALRKSVELDIALTPLFRRFFGGASVDAQILTRLCYELFSNTHEWARSEIDGTRIRKSFRGVLISKVDADSISGEADDPQSQYLLTCKRSGRPVLELSVFDAGVGLASRISGSPLSEFPTLDAEHTWLNECLRLRSSSSKAAMRGVGLHWVLSALNQFKGYIRIRSGRLSLFRNFLLDPYLETATSIQSKPELFNPRLLDFQSNYVGVSELSPIRGTLLTVLVPL